MKLQMNIHCLDDMVHNRHRERVVVLDRLLDRTQGLCSRAIRINKVDHTNSRQVLFQAPPRHRLRRTANIPLDTAPLDRETILHILIKCSQIPVRVSNQFRVNGHQANTRILLNQDTILTETVRRRQSVEAHRFQGSRYRQSNNNYNTNNSNFSKGLDSHLLVSLDGRLQVHHIGDLVIRNSDHRMAESSHPVHNQRIHGHIRA